MKKSLERCRNLDGGYHKEKKMFNKKIKLTEKIYADIKYATSLQNTPQYVDYIATRTDINEVIVVCGIDYYAVRLEKTSLLKALKESKLI